ncbi:MAG: beta-galactosidase [Clostridia bacterium]|nr:beta-galactosidase [Clostridia bacterium]
MYPNPIFAREQTTLLNDGWEFSFDNVTWQPINVPFCPQSKLSGIDYTDFIPVCYYKKKFNLDDVSGRKVLHFGAVDYRASVYVNGKYVGGHVGGYTPFEFDISQVVKAGENEIFLVVNDDEKGRSLSGKQSLKRRSYGCFYTRITGIWQSVWLEDTPEKYVCEFYFYPDPTNSLLKVDLTVSARGNYRVEVLFEGKEVGKKQGKIDYRKTIRLPLSEKHLWEEGKGNLYDVKIIFEDDVVLSYFGLRTVEYKDRDFFLNGKKTYQAFALDQGYNIDGLYTAPNVAFMEQDLRLGVELGFNGIRLHQKAFDPQFLYLCDRAGYMVWGEYASWGIDYSNLDYYGQFIQEWQQVMKRDFNHPSIILWCPLNEAWGQPEDPRKIRDVRIVDEIYHFTKKFDATRPCIDVSGGHHGHKTDVYDFHCYEDITEVEKHLALFSEQDKLDVPLLYCKYDKLRYKKGAPVHFSECGGISFGFAGADRETETVNEGAVQFEDAWGYGKGEVDGDVFVSRYCALIELISKHLKISGFCYTQLYDIEQEQNGLYYYDRSDKLTQDQKEKIRKCNEKIRKAYQADGYEV